MRQVSRSETEKFNHFPIVRMKHDQKLRKKFLPINIIYEPVKFQNEKINCFFLMKCIWLTGVRLVKGIE